MDCRGVTSQHLAECQLGVSFVTPTDDAGIPVRLLVEAEVGLDDFEAGESFEGGTSVGDHDEVSFQNKFWLNSH